MTREEAFAKLDEVFQDIFDDDTIHVKDETTAADIKGWDSLEHINLVVAVEQKFGIEFNTEEVNSFKNVGEMMDTILKRVS